MQTPLQTGVAPSYYHLILQPDLLGEWLLIREWGQLGARASFKRQVFMSQEEAEAAFLRLRDQQIKRGFQVMFTQGAEPPHRMSHEAPE